MVPFLKKMCLSPWTVSDLETEFAEIENDLIILSIISKSPHSSDITLQIESWMNSLHDLGTLD